MCERNQVVFLQRFYMTFLNNVKIFLVKNEKNSEFGFDYHRYMAQPLVLQILKRSFFIIPELKNLSLSTPEGSIAPTYVRIT